MALVPAQLGPQRPQVGPCTERVHAGQSGDQSNACRGLAQPPHVGAGVQRRKRALRVHQGLLDGTVGEESGGMAERVERCVDEPGPVSDRGERDPEIRAVGRAEAAQAPARDERSLVEARRLDVRCDRLRPIAGEPTVVPGLVVPLRLEEVQRKRRDVLLDRRSGRGLDRLGDATVELAPPPERQPFVGGVPHQCAAEPQPTGLIAIDETAEPFPERVVDLHLVAQGRGELDGVEGRTEHGRVAERSPIRGREPVDLGCDDCLHRVRQRGGRASRLDGVEQLEEEEHVAVGAARDLLGVMG